MVESKMGRACAELSVTERSSIRTYTTVFRLEKKDILAVCRMNFTFLGIFELSGCKTGEIERTSLRFTQHLI
jgi:hypothetical protein